MSDRYVKILQIYYKKRPLMLEKWNICRNNIPVIQISEIFTNNLVLLSSFRKKIICRYS